MDVNINIDGIEKDSKDITRIDIGQNCVSIIFNDNYRQDFRIQGEQLKNILIASGVKFTTRKSRQYPQLEIKENKKENGK